MGITHRKLLVKQTRTARKGLEIEFLVDSGAVYSLVPATRLKSLGIKAYKTVEFVLADGTKVSRRVGDAYFEYRGEGGAAPVIFGEPGDQPLLGATTLESLGLVLDPFRRVFHPMRMVLMSLRVLAPPP